MVGRPHSIGFKKLGENGSKGIRLQIRTKFEQAFAGNWKKGSQTLVKE